MIAVHTAAWALSGGAVGAALAPVTHRVMRSRPPMIAVLTVSAVVTLALWGLLAWRRQAWPELVVDSALAGLAVPLALVDVVERRLPTPLIRSLYAVSIAAAAGLDWDVGRLIRAAVGMTASLLVYLAIAMAFPGDLGAGDVRLAGAIGWILAWHSWSTLLAGAVLGAAAGGLAGAAFLAFRRSSQNRHMPAGPTMLLGALGALWLAV